MDGGGGGGGGGDLLLCMKVEHRVGVTVQWCASLKLESLVGGGGDI